MNDGRIKKGQRLSPATEFKPGQHWRPHQDFRNREWLIREYCENSRSAGDIADQFNLTESAVAYWLRKHGIKRRSISEARKRKRWGAVGALNPMYGRFGSLNPNFVDGGSPERQRAYAQSIGRQFLRDVIRRDGYRCRRCGGEKPDRRGLHVHHIKPWAGNPELRFDGDNVVTLCRHCHAWVHSNANSEGEYRA